MKLHILVPFLLTTLVTAVAPSGEVNNRVVDVDTEPSSEIHTVTQLTFKDAATPSNEAYNGVTADADVIHTLNLAARDVLDTATRCTAVHALLLPWLLCLLLAMSLLLLLLALPFVSVMIARCVSAVDASLLPWLLCLPIVMSLVVATTSTSGVLPTSSATAVSASPLANSLLVLMMRSFRKSLLSVTATTTKIVVPIGFALIGVALLLLRLVLSTCKTLVGITAIADLAGSAVKTITATTRLLTTAEEPRGGVNVDNPLGRALRAQWMGPSS
ncbi:uncharacterized protein ACLA_072980 [Aspergillus clavatus NRRL 1]|uniref:Integral membrane protein n=1 Tax=Aspergillus clavatus (strain ATCC 1007 / CBS 513.65 / DSM 816 / NCTC 3887 / NRRL 1 / QM 1276 / 107) TaxID=344612 RepID=A1C793_ASPCL|nr:uncharacterized protein ACLA_072980 [Aspergillus clavatus NRRL 1]EAW14264.1 conserved hypothetical protein [Aspergillus clavatus NRRL 1]